MQKPNKKMEFCINKSSRLVLTPFWRNLQENIKTGTPYNFLQKSGNTKFKVEITNEVMKLQKSVFKK